MKCHIIKTALALSLLALLAACGGGGGDTPTVIAPQPPTPQPAPEITLSAPAELVLAAGKPVTVDAKLSIPGAISWTLNPAIGTLSGNGNSAVYTPPATLAEKIRVTVLATSGSSAKSVNIMVYPNPGTPGISLVAGSGAGKVVVDGQGTDARLRNVSAMVADDQGNVYVNDANVLRQVTPAGAVRTIKEFTLQTSDGSTTGYFPQLQGIAYADGKLYAATAWRGTLSIQRVDSKGGVSKVIELPARKAAPGGMLADTGGQFYLRYENDIVRVAADGKVTVLAGREGASDGVDGAGETARFRALRDFALDQDSNLYVLDSASVRKITPGGQVNIVAGTLGAGNGAAVNGDGAAARFGNPQSFAFDTLGKLLILDRSGATPTAFAIRTLTAEGKVSTLLKGSDPAAGSASSVLRVGSGGAVFIGAGGRIDSVKAGGIGALAGMEDSSATSVDGVGSAARFERPAFLAADGAGNLYVTDMLSRNSGPDKVTTHLVLRKITPNGTVSTVVNQSVGTPSGIMADSAGNIYVATYAPGRTDSKPPYSGALYRVTPAGVLELVAGQPVAAPELRDGPGLQARFNQPYLDAIDAENNLYVQDKDPASGKTVWRKISPNGVVSTLDQWHGVQMKAPDGLVYKYNLVGQIVRVNADGSNTELTNHGLGATEAGPLPGRLSPVGHRPVPYGPYALAVIAGSAIYKVVLPH
ncbi:hypothetical protein [Pseudoduganella violacea]|uniref:Sugar lactone lactonase YvrE n=1 Tax=Pseudoduganella violacea TaxID=1715466 RepID=A0A7W5BE58_9BURK|nr:hypothetical protein [Pseudoduganella violacea]MBB3120555.1 sugar lactone lactonase YvrE [Pseudoduganella violacea]